MIRYIFIALLILLGIASLGSALFGRFRNRRIILVLVTVVAWGAAAMLLLLPPTPPQIAETLPMPTMPVETVPTATVAMSPTAVATIASPASPLTVTTATPASTGQIAWHSNRSGSLQVWVMNDDGSNPRQLTGITGSDTNVEPAWSPDGSQIVFVTDRDDVEALQITVIHDE